MNNIYYLMINIFFKNKFILLLEHIRLSIIKKFLIQKLKFYIQKNKLFQKFLKDLNQVIH